MCKEHFIKAEHHSDACCISNNNKICQGCIKQPMFSLRCISCERVLCDKCINEEAVHPLIARYKRQFICLSCMYEQMNLQEMEVFDKFYGMLSDKMKNLDNRRLKHYKKILLRNIKRSRLKMTLSVKNLMNPLLKTIIDIPVIPLIEKKKNSMITIKKESNPTDINTILNSTGLNNTSNNTSTICTGVNNTGLNSLKTNTSQEDKITALINSKMEYYTAPSISILSIESVSTNSYSQNKAEIMMESILPFFSQQQNFDILKEWLIKDENEEVRSGKSRRIVEWFLINYSKQYGTVYDIIRGKSLYKFFVSVEYTAALDCYKKDYFDTYCRKAGTVIELDYDNGKKLKTSVAQLNLFRWCIKNCILDYINNHFQEIQKDLQKRSSSSTKELIQKGKKRHLSNAYNKTLGIHPNVNLSISFDAPTNSISALETNSISHTEDKDEDEIESK